MDRRTKAQKLLEAVNFANRNGARLEYNEALELFNERLKDFGTYMMSLALQGKLFEKDYKGNLRCVNAEIEEKNNAEN